MPAPFRTLRRCPRACLALALFTLGLAAPAAAQPAVGEEESTRVFASRREVRVVFPAEPAGPWGWTEADVVRHDAWYGWTMVVDGAIGGPVHLGLALVARDTAVRAFPTLAALVAEGWTSICGAGMSNPCAFGAPEARVEDGRVVLVLRDSAEIVRLFGLRPSHVAVRRRRLAVESPSPADRVRVEYGNPAIPAPDSVLLARAARDARAVQASVNAYIRRISAGQDDDTPTLWLEVGDTAVISVDEMHCHYDSCYEQHAAVKSAGWIVADTTVVRLLPPGAAGNAFRISPPRVLVALRPGSSRLTVTGLSSSSDTLPAREPLPRKLTREIMVRPRAPASPSRSGMTPGDDPW